MKMVGKMVIFGVALAHVALVAILLPFLVGVVFAR